MVVAAAPDDVDAPSESKPKLTRAEQNRANCRQNPPAPGLPPGKSRSKYNALKHGLAAETVVLPGEDRDRYEATRLEYHNWIDPRNPLEALYVDCIVDDAWTLERTRRLAAAQLAEAVRIQTTDQDLADRGSMVEQSRLLLKNITDPAFCSTRSPNGGPEHPARLVAALETTVAGCDWLLDKFRELAMHLRAANLWCAQDGHLLIRLMGYDLGDVSTDDGAALLLVASQSVSAEPLAPSVHGKEERADDKRRHNGRTSGHPTGTRDKRTGSRASQPAVVLSSALTARLGGEAHQRFTARGVGAVGRPPGPPAARAGDRRCDRALGRAAGPSRARRRSARRRRAGPDCGIGRPRSPPRAPLCHGAPPGLELDGQHILEAPRGR